MKIFLFSIIFVALVLTTGCVTKTKTLPTASIPSSSPEVAVTEQVKAPPTPQAPENPQVTCVHESDKRILQMQTHGSGCNLIYTKYGKTASVVKSTNGTEACEKIEQKIRSKLESVGYDCK